MNLKVKPITKLFYHYYDYKIIMDADHYDEVTQGLDFFNSEHGQMVSKTKTVYSKGKVNLYFNGDESLDYYQKHYKDMIQSVSGPINDYHRSILLKKDIEIKKTLYYKKYRYKIKFLRRSRNSNLSGDILTKLKDMVRTNPTDYLGMNLYEQMSGRYHYFGLTPMVYVSDRQSLMMLELAGKEYISQRIKVITIKEIENNERYDEETN